MSQTRRLGKARKSDRVFTAEQIESDRDLLQRYRFSLLFWVAQQKKKMADTKKSSADLPSHDTTSIRCAPVSAQNGGSANHFIYLFFFPAGSIKTNIRILSVSRKNKRVSDQEGYFSCLDSETRLSAKLISKHGQCLRSLFRWGGPNDMLTQSQKRPILVRFWVPFFTDLE